MESDIVSLDFNSFSARYATLPFSETEEENPRFECGDFIIGVDYWSREDRSVSYIKKGGLDTLKLIRTGIIVDDIQNKINIVKDSLVASKGIIWFPKEMYRVKKIDYTKFNSELQKLNLKGPCKGRYLY